MYYADKIYNHLCKWNIVYVLGLYGIICFSDLLLFGHNIKEPSIVMMVIGFTFLGMTYLAQGFIQIRKRKIYNLAFMLDILIHNKR